MLALCPLNDSRPNHPPPPLYSQDPGSLIIIPMITPTLTAARAGTAPAPTALLLLLVALVPPLLEVRSRIVPRPLRRPYLLAGPARSAGVLLLVVRGAHAAGVGVVVIVDGGGLGGGCRWRGGGLLLRYCFVFACGLGKKGGLRLAWRVSHDLGGVFGFRLTVAAVVHQQGCGGCTTCGTHETVFEGSAALFVFLLFAAGAVGRVGLVGAVGVGSTSVRLRLAAVVLGLAAVRGWGCAVGVVGRGAAVGCGVALRWGTASVTVLGWVARAAVHGRHLAVLVVAAAVVAVGGPAATFLWRHAVAWCGCVGLGRVGPAAFTGLLVNEDVAVGVLVPAGYPGVRGVGRTTGWTAVAFGPWGSAVGATVGGLSVARGRSSISSTWCT